MPYQQVGNLWSAWPRFFLMLLVMLLLNSLWAYASLYIDFVKAPGSSVALSQAAIETNMLICWGLGMVFNTGLLVWSLRQRHVGESIAVFIGMLWLTYVSFCFYLMISFGYGIASLLESIQGKH
ncbi:hypothetical protein MON38_12490 [Hymenobacter sp. DH14]|uniref:Uncharacterized protein n=1 Tax=Hymenobacter cyanobacteriorum TaxID=2926463 RepID=A0A9X1VJL6_9BACT|nr:hypothetical protein [Hymenobacter cyanobacteriorum]MCI1188240.1 hypothetical protein [Hymenobacter cyanobacteriorum]